MRLPGETARLHALTLMHSAHTSTAWHQSAGTRHTHNHAAHIECAAGEELAEPAPYGAPQPQPSEVCRGHVARVGAMSHTAVATLQTICISNEVLSHRSIRT